MARPKSKVLLSDTDYKTGKVTEIITGEGFYYLTYQGKVFNLKITNAYAEMTPKYMKIAYPNRGHAIRLAEKLNKQFNCSDFTVSEFGVTEKVARKETASPPMQQPAEPFNEVARKLLEASRLPRVAPVILSVKSLKEIK